MTPDQKTEAEIARIRRLSHSTLAAEMEMLAGTRSQTVEHLRVEACRRLRLLDSMIGGPA